MERRSRPPAHQGGQGPGGRVSGELDAQRGRRRRPRPGPYQVEGYLPPDDFIAHLSLGAGKFLLNREEFGRGGRPVRRGRPAARRTDAGAEALYWLASVARYKTAHDPAQLRAGWDRLTRTTATASGPCATPRFRARPDASPPRAARRTTPRKEDQQWPPHPRRTSRRSSRSCCATSRPGRLDGPRRGGPPVTYGWEPIAGCGTTSNGCSNRCSAAGRALALGPGRTGTGGWTSRRRRRGRGPRPRPPGSSRGTRRPSPRRFALVMCAARGGESSDKESGYREWSRQEFYEAVPLPTGVDANKVEARYRNGILSVTVPKTEESKARRITVQG